MSRGHGHTEQAILQAIQQTGIHPINDPSKTVSENSSRHRAAKKLEQQGFIGIIHITSGGRRRSIAVTPEEAKRYEAKQQRKETKRKQAELERLRKELGLG